MILLLTGHACGASRYDWWADTHFNVDLAERSMDKTVFSISDIFIHDSLVQNSFYQKKLWQQTDNRKTQLITLPGMSMDGVIVFNDILVMPPV